MELLFKCPKNTQIDGYFLFFFGLFCILFLRVRKRTITIVLVVSFLISCPDTNTGWTLCKLLMLTSFIQFRFRGYTTVPVTKVLHLLTGVHRNEPFVVLLRHLKHHSLLISLCQSPHSSFKETSRPLLTCPFPSPSLHWMLYWLRVVANGFPPRGSTLLQRHLYTCPVFNSTVWDYWPSAALDRCSNMLQRTPYVRGKGGRHLDCILC